MTQPKNEIDLTGPQEKLWTDTRVALLWNCPAFSHILYTLMNKRGTKNIAWFTSEVPIAATDGKNLLLNPETFFKFNLNERVFIVAHEIMHAILNHMVLMHQCRQRGKVPYLDGTVLDYDHDTMNIAMDLVINDILVQAKVGAFNKGWLHDPSKVSEKDDVYEAYRKIYKKSGGGGKGGAGAGQAGFDEHLAPGGSEGKDPNQAAQERMQAQTEWQTEIAAAAASAKAQGRLPAGLDRLLSEVLDPKVDWKEKIRALFARKVGSGSFDWRKPDRRLISRTDAIYAPGRSGFGAGDVVVAVDTSGSIGQKELDMFFAEMAGILEDVRPKRMFVVWCDAAIGRVDELDEPADLAWVKKKGAPGGGGTSFIPVFEWMKEMMIEPDALVYLTDGMGSFPNAAPSYPVIWGNIYPSSKYPFGDVVDIPYGPK